MCLRASGSEEKWAGKGQRGGRGRAGRKLNTRMGNFGESATDICYGSSGDHKSTEFVTMRDLSNAAVVVPLRWHILCAT